MNKTYDYMKRDPLVENGFQMIKFKEGADVKDNDHKESDVERTLWVRHKLLDTEKETKQLFIECSSDGVQWSPLELDYEGFRQKVAEAIKTMLAAEESGCTIHLSWLTGFQVIPCVRLSMGYGWAMYCISIGAIEQEEWKTKVWDIFDDLEDDFWNSDRVRFNCHMQNNETAVSLFANYNHESSELQKAELMSNYHAFLLSALHTLLREEEELPLETCICVHWSPGSSEHIVKRELDRQLAAYGASLIRKRHNFYVSRSRQLQEQEREAITKRRFDIITTLQGLHPTMYLIVAHHKTRSTHAIVGCYRDQRAAEYIASHMNKWLPEMEHITYEVTPIVSQAISAELLHRLDYTDKLIVTTL